MVKRPTWIMLILLAAAAGLYWYLQQPDNLASKAFNAGATPTLGMTGSVIPPEKIVDGFSLESAEGQVVSIVHENGTWMVVAGKKDVANQDEAASAINQIQALQSIVKIDQASDLATFGLDQPSYILKLVITDGTIITLKIGDATAIDNGYYAQKEDGTVIVISKYAIEFLTQVLAEPPFQATANPEATPEPGTPTLTP
ncbi:MAG: DUF4340 domain-containing protein [Chloroflexi bacterium]|nr:MAG: DUF4340 domain-containing protein [Chloroflexota bacterium]